MNIWIDILHTPQFNFYKPFITMLSERGYKVYVTARNSAERIGRHTKCRGVGDRATSDE